MKAEVYVIDNAVRAQALYRAISGAWKPAADRGHPLVVTVEEDHDQRSTVQNRRYWALLGEVSKGAWVGTGKRKRQHHAEVWHEFFKGKLIGHEEVTVPFLDARSRWRTKVFMRPISSTTLTVAQFSEYMQAIEAYAVAELGIELT